MLLIVNHLPIHYDRQGSGPELFLLHGWGDDLHTFDSLMPELFRHYTVTRLDLPGFGQTKAPETPWKLRDYADCVEAFLLKLQIQPIVIVGHSFGGRIAIKGIAQGILKPAKLVLIGAAGVSYRPPLRNQLLAIFTKIGNVLLSIPGISHYRETLRRGWYRWLGSDYADHQALRQTLVNIVQENLFDCLAQINIPTLLIWGEKDSATPLRDGQLMADNLPNSRLITYPQAGHFVHQECFAKVAAEIVEHGSDIS